MGELKIKDLLALAGTFRVEVPELVSSPCEIVCITGPSGSGKSTLLNTVTGFLPLQRGSITLGNVRLDCLPPEKRKMALVFQRSALFPHLNIRENVEFGLRVQGMASEERKRVAKGWLEKWEVGDLAERRASQISEGQAQRVALARACAPGFPILLLDEPFSALDPDLRARLRENLRALVKENKLILWMVTHHPDDTAIADKVFRLDAGKLSGG